MIRAAVVGLGWWGAHIIRRLSDSKIVRVSLAVDTLTTRRNVAEEHGIAFTDNFHDALADPDIDLIILATPHRLHVKQIVESAQAGKHVFCEKPLALDTADVAQAVRTCRKFKVHLGVGHERRFEPSMTDLYYCVRNGVLGTLMHVEANFSHDKLLGVQKGDWRDAPDVAMTGTGIHLTDAFIYLFGPVEQVYASVTSRVAFADHGDVASVQLRFESGMTGYLSAILATPLYMRLVVFGSDAWAEIRNNTHPDEPGTTQLTVRYRDGRREERTYEWSDTVRANLELFALSLRSEADYPFTDDQKVGNIAVLSAIRRSAAFGAPVAVGWGDWS